MGEMGAVGEKHLEWSGDPPAVESIDPLPRPARLVRDRRQRTTTLALVAALCSRVVTALADAVSAWTLWSSLFKCHLCLEFGVLLGLPRLLLRLLPWRAAPP